LWQLLQVSPRVLDTLFPIQNVGMT